MARSKSAEAPARRLLLSVLLFCALFLRASIPAGFMPSDAGDGIFLTLCTGQGPVQVSLETGQPDKSPQSLPDTCVFALSAAPASLPSLVPLPLSNATAFVQAVGLVVADLVLPRLAAPPPPALAPPHRL